MKKKESLYVIVSVILLIIGIFFCYRVINNNKKNNYSENSNTSYIVCLKENDYYNDSCLQEGKEYLGSLTKKIRVNFNYIRTSQFKYNLEYYIGAKLKISNRDNSKEIYDKNIVLTDKKKISNEKDVLNIVEETDIEYDEYADLADKYTKDYSLNTNSVLQVYLSIKEGKNERIVSSVTIPINEQTYSINKEDVDRPIAEPDDSNKAELLIGIMAIVFSIVIILFAIYKLIENSKEDEFEQEVKRILTEYDRVIVETKLEGLKLTGKELIEINDFMELIDVRDTIEKPIMYFRNSDFVRDFVVQDGEIVYRYRMIDKERDVGNIEDPIFTRIETNKNNPDAPIITKADINNQNIESPAISEMEPNKSDFEGPTITEVDTNNENLESPVISEMEPNKNDFEVPVITEIDTNNKDPDTPVITEVDTNNKDSDTPVITEVDTNNKDSDTPVITEVDTDNKEIIWWKEKIKNEKKEK